MQNNKLNYMITIKDPLKLYILNEMKYTQKISKNPIRLSTEQKTLLANIHNEYIMELKSQKKRVISLMEQAKHLLHST